MQEAAQFLSVVEPANHCHIYRASFPNQIPAFDLPLMS
jgi:hypothetical protein